MRNEGCDPRGYNGSESMLLLFMASETFTEVIPSPTPTEEDIRKWNALPRDEQLRRRRAALSHPDCATATTQTMSDILAEARERADSSRG